MYIVATVKKLTHNKIISFDKLFVLHYFAFFFPLDPLVLHWHFVADNIKLIFSMSNVNIIVGTKLQPNNSLHSSNQTE